MRRPCSLWSDQYGWLFISDLSIQALRLAEVAKARHKIEETHKNYYALLASSDVGTAGDPLKEKKNPGESMSLMRNEWYAFTATGMYRP